jgi:hypothetical protein
MKCDPIFIFVVLPSNDLRYADSTSGYFFMLAVSIKSQLVVSVANVFDPINGLDGFGENVRPSGDTSYIATTSTATPVADFNTIGAYSFFFSFP